MLQPSMAVYSCDNIETLLSQQKLAFKLDHQQCLPRYNIASVFR